MAKKTFENSPVMQFITQPQTATEPAAAPAGGDQSAEVQAFNRLPEIPRQTYTTKKPLMRRAKEGQEPRDRRIQLLFKKSVFMAIRDIADKNRASFNHMVEAILCQYIEQYNAERNAKKSARTGSDQGEDGE